MIDRQALLAGLQRLLPRLEADLLERSQSAEAPHIDQQLRAEYERASAAGRTAQNYEDWRSDYITQMAAAWILSIVFVRFLEDNRLIDPPKLSGPGDRLQRARDEHELYFRAHPRENDRDYLLAVIDELVTLPGASELFGAHNPIHELPNWLSGDAAKDELLPFFQKIDPNTGRLVHDFTEPPTQDGGGWDTRFLGDLYQDLSVAARKKYALLQTPEFVEEFILDRTLDPALDEFGLTPALPPGEGQGDGKPTAGVFKMIDPACGSGHFLLGAFRRILDQWQRQEPGTNVRELIRRTLDSIHGVDINPYAVAIARFRLLLAALRACGIRRLADAPAFHLNLVCGDSLLHAPLASGQQLFDYELTRDDPECEHAYLSEDLSELKRLLSAGQYHAVVANPPYITPKDRQLNERYRKRFGTCHMKYSLAVPFMEQLFRLAISPPTVSGEGRSAASEVQPAEGAGYVGQITANSFMKREFGKKLIEAFLPKIDLTHVIDTSGAYIPGHGTPTVLLFGRGRPPLANTIRTVMGIQGEPATPAEPARGMVWTAIVDQLDRADSQSAFVSVADSPREGFHKHPWSIGGGGAAELKEQLDDSSTPMHDLLESIGFASFTGQDEAFVGDESSLRRASVSHSYIKRFVVGDTVRDWSVQVSDSAFAPYDPDFNPIELDPDQPWARWIWPMRTTIGAVISFGGRTRLECGDKWWTWYRWISEKYRTPLSIVFGEVATHNHFVLDRGEKVFKQTAPAIKLPACASEDEHLALLGLLNSSTACFWMKQMCHNKGSAVDQHGARQRTAPFEDFFAFNATKLQRFPLPAGRPLRLTQQLDEAAQQLDSYMPRGLLARWRARGIMPGTNIRESFEVCHGLWINVRAEMIALQEELDWECYRLYGLIADDLTTTTPPHLALGQRAFEIVLARRIAAGDVQTTWFERHGSTPIIELPSEWPVDYRRLVERRIELIENDPNIRLIEQPEYKRRWNTESWDSQLERALRHSLLDQLESYFDFDGRMNDEGMSTAALDIMLVSVAKLADFARQDTEFLQVGELYKNDHAFDVERLVAELVEDESVPLLPVLRYKESGLRKRGEWEQTWELQRREDAGEAVDSISVPPKYTSADFQRSHFWRLRGKLDVPKERWVSFPHCEGPDGTLMLAWAGYDHLQLARAVASYYVDVKERFGGREDARLPPLLACLVELLPWLKQWHDEPDASFDGLRMGDYFEGFVMEEARQLPRADGEGTGWSLDEIKAWRPPQRTGRSRRNSRIRTE